MDKQVRKLKEGGNHADDQDEDEDNEEDDDNRSENGKFFDNDEDFVFNGADGDIENHNHHEVVRIGSDGRQRCQNCCTTATGSFHRTIKGLLCTTCYSFWEKTGTMAKQQQQHQNGSKGQTVVSSSSFMPPLLTKRRKVPKGMYIDKEDIMKLATGPTGTGEAILRSLDQDIISLKREVQKNKQTISYNKHKISLEIDQQEMLQIEAVSPLMTWTVTWCQWMQQQPVPQKIMARWTREEELLAVQGFRKYGKDFQNVASMLGTKTEAHVKTFFANNEKKYHLMEMINQYTNEYNQKYLNHQHNQVSSTTDHHINNHQNNHHPSSASIGTRGKNRPQDP